MRSWRDRTLVLLGTRYLYRGIIKQGKYYFMRVIDAYHQERNVQGGAETWLLLGKAMPGPSSRWSPCGGYMSSVISMAISIS
ncbi:MAG TPA: hypothetical protein VHW43_00725 [Puia sp.]|nr:hypothetical protein [Puia sp.]